MKNKASVTAKRALGVVALMSLAAGASIVIVSTSEARSQMPPLTVE